MADYQKPFPLDETVTVTGHEYDRLIAEAEERGRQEILRRVAQQRDEYDALMRVAAQAEQTDYMSGYRHGLRLASDALKSAFGEIEAQSARPSGAGAAPTETERR